MKLIASRNVPDLQPEVVFVISRPPCSGYDVCQRGQTGRSGTQIRFAGQVVGQRGESGLWAKITGGLATNLGRCCAGEFSIHRDAIPHLVPRN
jgi:hypothetical protein